MAPVSTDPSLGRWPLRAARLACCALLGATASALLLVVGYGLRPDRTLEMDGTYPLPEVVDGLYAPEYDPGADRSFAWMRQHAHIILPGLDRARAWDVVVLAAGMRPDVSTLPELAIAINGVVMVRERMTNDFRAVRAAILPDARATRGVTISVTSSSTFVPGNGDRRQLGVMLDRLELRLADGGFPLAPPGLLAAGAVSGGILAVLCASLGLPLWVVATTVSLLAVLHAWAMLAGFGAYDVDPWRVAAAAAAVAVVAWLINVVGQRVNGTALSTVSRAAIATTAAVLVGRLQILLHPMMYVGDSVFHLHRLSDVLRGNYYFTSKGPDGVFPYPIALYLCAELFTAITRDHVLILRTLVAVAGAVAGLTVYWMVVRGWKDRVAGMAALVCVFAAPIDFTTQAAANQTNAFAQSLSVAALALLAGPATVPVFVGSVVVLATAMLSHTSTFAILFVTVLLLVVLLWRHRDASCRRVARRSSLALVIATLAALLLYYGHFGPVYREQATKLTSPRPAVASVIPVQSPKAHKTPWAPGWVPLRNRVAAVPGYAARLFGVPLILLAFVGIREMRRRESTTMTSVVSATLAACVLFLLLGLLTPIDMRYYLAAYPALAILAGLAASWLWRMGKPGQAGVAVILIWMSVAAGMSWVSWLP